MAKSWLLGGSATCAFAGTLLVELRGQQAILLLMLDIKPVTAARSFWMHNADVGGQVTIIAAASQQSHDSHCLSALSCQTSREPCFWPDADQPVSENAAVAQTPLMHRNRGCVIDPASLGVSRTHACCLHLEQA